MERVKLEGNEEALALRIVGDLVDTLGRWRVWGGLLNAVALLLFLVSTARAIATARPASHDL